MPDWRLAAGSVYAVRRRSSAMRSRRTQPRRRLPRRVGWAPWRTAPRCERRPPCRGGREALGPVRGGQPMACGAPDAHVLAESKGLADQRRSMLDGLSGSVVEIGAGNGLNFRHYPSSTTVVHAFEPDPHLHPLAARARLVPAGVGQARPPGRSLRALVMSCVSETQSDRIKARRTCSMPPGRASRPDPRVLLQRGHPVPAQARRGARLTGRSCGRWG